MDYARPPARREYIQLAMAAASLLSPWRMRVVVAGALYARIVDVAFRLPGVTNADVAAVLFDASVMVGRCKLNPCRKRLLSDTLLQVLNRTLLSIATCGCPYAMVCVAGHITGLIATWPRVVDAAGRSVRAQLACLYLLRGFWKLNTSYLNPATSCAPIPIMQFLDAYTPALWLSGSSAEIGMLTDVARVAPWASVAMELGIGTMMLCGQGRVGRVVGSGGG